MVRKILKDRLGNVERGIIPFSKLSFNYDSHAGCFYVSRSQEFSCSGKEENRVLIETAPKGGKIWSFKFEGHGAFDVFRKELLPNYVREGYLPRMVDVPITTYHLTGYNQGDYADTQLLFFGAYSKSPLELRFGGRETSDDQVKDLRKWFDSLKKK